MKRFGAPWSKSLVVISTLTTLLCLGIALMPHTPATPANPRFFWLRAVPIALIVGSALFTIRGYSLTSDNILIHRLLWSTRFPLDGIQSADFQPGAMRGAWRTCGNGGLFSFSGFYRNRILGAFRAFVTDPSRAVVLRYPNCTIVLSPSDPESFVREVSPHARNL
jgi:hypothetical protein